MGREGFFPAHHIGCFFHLLCLCMPYAYNASHATTRNTQRISPRMPRAMLFLSKISHTGLKDILVLLPGNVHRNRITPPLGMRHLAKHPSVRACNALDGIV